MFRECFSFDAYTCGLDCSFDQLSHILERDGFRPASSYPKYGYDFAFTFRNKLDEVIFVMFGQHYDYLYVSSMGHISNYLYEVTRQFEGRLMRADVKLDFEGAENFDLLVPNLIDLAQQKNIKISQVGDWALKRDGRTLYIGSRSSAYMLRFYEKFKQSNLIDDIQKERVRLELEIKPERPEQKKLAFKMTCIELLESSKTYHPLFSALIQDFGHAVSLTSPKRISNLATTVKHLNKQYKNTFEAVLEHCSGDLSKFYEILMTGKLND